MPQRSKKLDPQTIRTYRKAFPLHTCQQAANAFGVSYDSLYRQAKAAGVVFPRRGSKAKEGSTFK